ncbi:MAG: winged helix-turn-helix transcriptional regulator [Planctomycetes bacterium]|nr:winged helix-turn-helix transcriptional regulator [Planctomycetota bacterium]
MRRSRSRSLRRIDIRALEEACGCLRTIAHPHRLRMIEMMLAGEFTVGELAKACAIPSHMASEHLGKMKDRGLLACERRGRRCYYRIQAEGLPSIMDCIRQYFDRHPK